MMKWKCEICKAQNPCYLEDVGGVVKPTFCPWVKGYECQWECVVEDKKIGDMVTWTSQSRGRTTTKTGTIVRVLKKSEFVQGLNPCRIAINEFPRHKRKFSGANIPGRAETGCLVEVIAGPNAAPRLYMPYPSKLTVVKKKHDK